MIPRHQMVVNWQLKFDVLAYGPMTTLQFMSCSTNLRCVRQWPRSTMARDENETSPDRVFSLFEANQLIPQLQSHLSTVQKCKTILIRTREEVSHAAANALLGGGTPVGAGYVKSLQDISANLHAIHELGVVVKDIDLGLCDFPHIRDGRVVYLCWKLGESEVRWWHEVTTGYKDRCPIEEEPA